MIVWPFIQVAYPQQANRIVGRISPQATEPSVVSPPPGLSLATDPISEGDIVGPTGEGGQNDFVVDRALTYLGRRFVEPFYDIYLAPRFDRDTGKVFRTGAVDIALEYPSMGLGLNVVNRTTDSMALGVFIMSGAIGSTLYLAMLLLLSIRLFRISRLKFDPDVAATARVLLILTVVFLIVSVAFHTFIQDRAGDAYWLLAGVVIGPMAMRTHKSPGAIDSDADGDGATLEEEL